MEKCINNISLDYMNSEAIDFAAQHCLMSTIETAMRWIREIFICKMERIVLIHDPESGESWLSIRFTVNMNVEQLERARNVYHYLFAKNVSPSKRFLVRIMYDIAETS